ncbi:MAG: hypothetical protein NC254_10530 [bacterium]|nr:hypothetical protein [bacterium]
MEKRSFLENVCGILMEELASAGKITEDQVFSLMEELSAREPAELRTAGMNYKKMCSAIGEVWQYREWEKMQPDQAFLYGSLWGIVKFFECRYQEMMDADQMKVFVQKYKDKVWLLRAIKTQPGILHKELAQKGRIGSPRLSQIMNDDPDIKELVFFRTSGREKYYFLKPKGEELLDRLKKETRKTTGSRIGYGGLIEVKKDRGLVDNQLSSEKVMPFEEPWDNLMTRSVNFLDGYLNLSCADDSFMEKGLIGENVWESQQSFRSTQSKGYLKNGLEIRLAK